MNYLLIASLAYVLNAFSVLVSKVLLSKNSKHPLSYVFYISAFSLSGLLVFPYLFLKHVQVPGLETIILASISTLSWTLGAYFLFSALKIGLADRVAPAIGTLTPIFLLLYYQFFDQSLSLNQIWSIIFMTLGLLVLILPYLNQKSIKAQVEVKRQEVYFEVLAGFFFAVSYILLKVVYSQTDFLSGLAYSRLVLVPLILVCLAVPYFRKLIFSGKDDKISFWSKTGILFLAAQLAGGASQLLINYAIFLANPAIVNSLAGVQYAFLFVVSLILAKPYPKIFPEEKNIGRITQNIAGILFVVFGLFILAYANETLQSTALGFTYSPRYAQSLGLSPKATYIEALDQLNPQTVRLPIYWDEIEQTPENFDFSDTDYYVSQAKQRGVKLTLVVGYKVPRYPECFIPEWAKNLNQNQFNSALFNEIKTVVNHYKSFSSVSIWQVENEPLFPFGSCPSVDLNRLKKEISIVHQTEPGTAVMVTESGEFGFWLTTAKNADIVGTTLYRRTLAPYVPWFKSPVPPFFYQLKGMVVHLFFPQKPVYVSELQEEPWSNIPLNETNYSYQREAFPLSDLEDNINFSRTAGFNTIYAWGVEWWYYLKMIGHPEYVNKAIMIFNDIK